jgi:uncharacterized damage-inducible protein DinB
LIDYLRRILAGQYEAALSMLHRGIATCPDEHWESKIANGTVRWGAYHALFFTEYYLSSETGFELREVHHVGGDERGNEACEGLGREDALGYCAYCRQLALESLARETVDSMQAHCGFSWHTITRGEMHVYNIRHIQHHAAQVSAFLRRIGVASHSEPALRWVRNGWHLQ